MALTSDNRFFKHIISFRNNESMEFTDLEPLALLVCSASTIACLVSSNVCGFLGIDIVDKVGLIPFVKI